MNVWTKDILYLNYLACFILLVEVINLYEETFMLCIAYVCVIVLYVLLIWEILSLWIKCTSWILYFIHVIILIRLLLVLLFCMIFMLYYALLEPINYLNDLLQDNAENCIYSEKGSSLERVLIVVTDPVYSFSSQILSIPFLWHVFPNLKQVFIVLTYLIGILFSV